MVLNLLNGVRELLSVPASPQLLTEGQLWLSWLNAPVSRLMPTGPAEMICRLNRQQLCCNVLGRMDTNP